MQGILYQNQVSAISETEFIQRMKEHVEFLARDEMRGRGPGDSANQIVTRYIAEEFRKAGLINSHANRSYFQSFTRPDTNTIEKNVIGILPSSIPSDKSIVITAHYDGLGIDETKSNGDNIYNGALDNAVDLDGVFELLA